jgi:hypothetical protein
MGTSPPEQELGADQTVPLGRAWQATHNEWVGGGFRTMPWRTERPFGNKKPA